MCYNIIKHMVLSDSIIEELKEKNDQKWHLIISRPGTPPLDFSVAFGSSPRMNKVLGTDWTIESLKWQDHKFFISEIDKQKMLNFLRSKLSEDKDFILDILEQGEKHCDNLIKESSKYEKNYYEYFNKIYEIQKETGLYFRIVLKLEIILQEKFPKIKFLEPLKLNYIMKFHNALIKLSNAVKNKQDIEKEIDKLIEEFGWMTIFHYTGNFLTAKDIQEKIDTLLREEENAKTVPKPPEDINLKIYRYVIFLRTHLAESFAYSNAKAKPLLEKIAKKYGITYEDITFITGDELIESLKRGELIVPKEEINSRKRRFGLFLHNKKVYILNEKECDGVFGKEKISTRKVKILKGSMACAGKAKGEVCIVKNFLDFSKFKPNGILVAHSTTPNYIILMHMAKAFLTQEGGITSHAAIVSREMKKPCIVGIKNLMQELKDGDIVEVDADKGIVKIIKRK